MKVNKTSIDFSTLGGPVYIGRARGESVRVKLELDMVDSSDEVINVIIPDDTYAINSSFFLGMFGISIRKAGSREQFLKKYNFKCKSEFLEIVESCIIRALQDKKNIF